MAQDLLLGLVGGDEALLGVCQDALREIASVHPLTVDATPEALGRCALLLLVLREPFDWGMSLLARWRETNLALPVLILGDGQDAGHADELVKCGAADYLALPPDSVALRRKVDRVLLGVARQAPDREVLKPRVVVAEDVEGVVVTTNRNRRRCYRARVPQTMAATACIALVRDQARLNVENISVHTDGLSGGMALTADAATAARLPLASWRPGTQFAAGVQLPGEPTPIHITARIIRVIRSCDPNDRAVCIAIQYDSKNTRDEEKFKRFWVQCQRAEVRLAKEP